MNPNPPQYAMPPGRLRRLIGGTLGSALIVLGIWGSAWVGIIDRGYLLYASGSFFTWLFMLVVAVMPLILGGIILFYAFRPPLKERQCRNCMHDLGYRFKRGCPKCGWRRRTCPTCGYDLRGASKRGCPECGWGREQ